MVNTITGLERITGVSKASTLWYISRGWSAFDIDDSFYQLAFERSGLADDTIDRYIDAWDVVEKNRKVLDTPTLQSYIEKPIEALIAVGQHAKEYGPPSKGQMKILINSADTTQLREKLNEFKGKKSSGKKGTQFVLRKDGTLEAWVNNEGLYLGYLDRSESPNAEKRNRALASLFKRAGIVEAK